MLICGHFNTLACDAIYNSETLMEDRNLGIPETAMSCFKSTDLLLNNDFRFVNGRSESDCAAKASFDNGSSSSVIDYVESWKSILNMTVVHRVEYDHNPLVVNVRMKALGLGNVTGRAPGFYESEIVPSNFRRKIRWDGEKYQLGLPQLEFIKAN
ncbi:hypothetical protein NDU88_000901 [Pleurodeles waltl]|uniref:Endonuclease/exonuclease/phosphatase domain-containing protein n=1 Tax=Pleurodeles waltl TaxID=8319 RepID=A0AAV7TI52_PLEWA|nr:hypothetical protein NDU88_000901 [Pleurodeles waltl]